jgi:FAD/FMN-containing dehydrogenase
VTSALIQELSVIIGTEFVLSGHASAPYCQDQRGNYRGQADAVVFPAGTQQVSEVVRYCAQHKIAMVPQGGNSSLCGGAVPLAQDNPAKTSRQIVINLSRMNAIRNCDTLNYTMTVEAGCTLAQVRAHASHYERLFPLSLTAIDSRCEIGGNLSTNAGGIGVLRYGNTRELVLGLEVVLADGRIWHGLRSLRKDNTGYDLKHLFVGAEGTLGIITAAVLKLFPQTKSQASACIALDSPASAVALLAHLRATCGDRISAFEIVSRPCIDLVLKHYVDTQEPFKQKHAWMVVTQLSDVLDIPLDTFLGDAIASFPAGVAEYLVTANTEQAAGWWNLRKYISDAQKKEGVSVKHDIAVPISNVATFIEQADAALKRAYPGVRIVAFGHIGDGNIHYNPSMPDAQENEQFFNRSAEINNIVYEIVAQLNGTISAEHGIGQLKREEIKHYKSALEIELMQHIKNTLDPDGLMNPGKVI